VAYVGRIRIDPVEQPAPELGLPDQVVVEGMAGAVGVATLAPVGDQPRPLRGIRREQRSQSAGHGVAAIAAQVAVITLLAVAEMRGQGGAPRLVEVVVDGGQQRPDELVGLPQVVPVAVEQHGHERARIEEPHSGADPVTATGTDTQSVTQPLGEPPLDPLRRHHHDLLGERVVERGREQLAEGVGQLVGARRAMEMEGHLGRL
jgi:hypothetical protein